MLEGLGLPMQGRHHSGIDDCRNIARVLIALAQRGAPVRERPFRGNRDALKHHLKRSEQPKTPPATPGA